MTELERAVAAVIAQRLAAGRNINEPIPVADLLDDVLPYRVARRALGIDVNEDYEALMLRLLSEEENLVRVTPPDAAELARATVAAQLPDLGVLRLLRSASIVLNTHVAARLAALAPAPAAAPATVAPSIAPAPAPSAVEPEPAALLECWSCATGLPTGRSVKFCPFCGADQRQPVCLSCGAAAERGWKHCPDCGAAL